MSNSESASGSSHSFPVLSDGSRASGSRKELPVSRLSALETSHSTSSSTSNLSTFSPRPIPATQVDNDQDTDVATCASTRTSLSTPTTPTPRQYGIGRRVVSGSDFGCNIGESLSSKRDSKRTSMNESTLDSTKSQDGDEDNMTFVLGGEVVSLQLKAPFHEDVSKAMVPFAVPPQGHLARGR